MIPQRDDLGTSESSEARASMTPRTSFENVLTGTPNALARPKSPIFNSPFLLIDRFCGFRKKRKHGPPDARGRTPRCTERFTQQLVVSATRPRGPASSTMFLPWV